MSVQNKYQAVLDLGAELGATGGSVKEENGILTITGTVENAHQKNMLWDKIKAIGGNAPTDIVADIQISRNDIYASYTVKSGDTLGKISKQFYGEPKKYMQIFNANQSILDHPDKIEVGQELSIPFEQD